VAGEDTLHVHRGLDIPLSEVTWRATTSGGPGGQHANRTLSRVEVSFDVNASATLGPRQRARLLERLGPVVRAAAADSRSQARNREQALARLATKLHDGLRVDPDRRPRCAGSSRSAVAARPSATGALRETTTDGIDRRGSTPRQCGRAAHRDGPFHPTGRSEVSLVERGG
jgi:ribosome-associated protein